MAVELVQRTGGDLSGDEGRDVLVGQGAEIQEITAPESGATKNISLGKGQTATLNFDATTATPLIEGNDFVLTFDTNDDGSADSRIVFQNLVEESQGADAPVLVIGGVELSTGLLIGQAQALGEGETLETAAGADAGPTGGGGSQYNDNLGDVIDGLSALGTIGETELEFGLIANGDDITDPAEGTFDVSFITTGTAVGEIKGGIEARDYDGGFEDWGPNQHIGNEGPAPMQVEFNFTPADNETLDSIVIEALPENAVLYIGGSDAANIYSGPFPVTITPGDFDQVFIKPDTNSDVDLTLNVTANISDPDSGESASIPVEVVAVIDAVADKPIFGNEGGLDGDGLVDLYLLQDLSGSFSDDVPNVQQAVADLIGKIKNGDFSADVHLGAGSFIDKAIDRLGSHGDYVYKNAQDVSADLDAVKAAVDAFTLGSGGDGPEAQIEALFNLAKNAADLGFREGATKYVVLTTDADFHKAGDALRLGKNDGDGDLTNDLDEDYPELAQLKAALEASGVVPVFMVTSDVKDTYKDLIDFLGRGKVLDLSSDSSNLLANLLKGISGPSDNGDNVFDEQAIVEVPVDVTFSDNDGSETHTIVLSNIPSDWIPELGDLQYTVSGLGGKAPGTVGLNTTYSITIDVTSLGENVDLNFEFNPQDWSSSRWSDGESHSGGDAVIKIKAIAEETNTTDEELTTDNNRSESETTHTVKVIEDTPTVEEVSFSHDETDGVDAGTGDQASLSATIAAALVKSSIGEHVAVIGQAQGDVAFDFKTDGSGAPTDAVDVDPETLEFEDYDGAPSGLYTGGDDAPVAITLHTDDANPNIVWGLDPSGNAVFAVHLGQPGTASSGSVKMTFVQYGQINHDVDGSSSSDHNDVQQLVLKYRAVDDEGDASPYAEAKVDLKDDGPSITGSKSSLDEGKFVQGEYDLVNATDPVTITVTSADVSRASFHNSIGFYVADASGNLIGGQIIVADGHSSLFAVGSDVSVNFNKADYPDGATFGFFIVPNGGNKNGHLGGNYTDGADVTFVDVNGKLVPHINGVPVKGSGEPAYFSNPTLNSDGTAHVYDNGHGGNYNWEDLRFPYADADYSDLNVQIKVDGAKNADAPVGGAVSGKLEFDVGTDVVGHKFEITGPSDLISDGETVTAGTPIVSGSLLIVEGKTADGDLVYKLTFDTKSGKYVYSQYRALDHNDPNDEVLPVKFGVKLTDGDGDTATADIVVNIKDSLPVAGENKVVIIDDDDVIGADGNAGGQGDDAAAHINGTLEHNYGADGAGSVVLLNEGAPAGFTYELNPDGTVLTVMQGAVAVLKVALDDTTSGKYTVTQLNPIKHTPGADENNTDFDFKYRVTDGDNDSVDGALKVSIDDDTPVFKDNSLQTVELAEVSVPPAGGIYSLAGVNSPVTVELAKIANVDTAGFNSSYGYFFVNAAGEPIEGKVLWSNAKDHDGQEDGFTIDPASMPNGAVGFGFFLIPNGDTVNQGLTDNTDVTFKEVNGKWVAFAGNTPLNGSGAPVFFSKPDLNPDGADHEVDNGTPGNSNWEDLLIPKGDGDHDDVNVNVVVKGTPCAQVSGVLSFKVGADLADASLKLIDEVSDVTSGGEAVTATVNGDGTQIIGITTSGEVVYVIALKDVDLANGSAKYNFVQFRQIDHSSDSNTNMPVKFSVTLKDGDGDTTTTNIVINLKDSIPTAADAIVRFDESKGIQGWDERAAPDGAISKATAALSFDFGKDHAGGEIALTDKDGNSFNGFASDLTDAQTGQKIYLFTENGEVVGRVGTGGSADANGAVAFRASLDQQGTGDAADFVFLQLRAIEHGNANSHSDWERLDDIHYVVKDGDGDKTSPNKIIVDVRDDGPTVDQLVTSTVDEGSLPGATAIAKGEIDVDFGADGGEFTAITLDAVTDSNGDPINLTDLSSGGNPVTVWLTENGDDLVLVGYADGKAVFDVYLNKETGDYTYRQFGALDHKGAKLDAALKLVFGYEVTDGDGDTDKGQLIVEVADSGPVIENATTDLDEDNFVQGVYDLDNAEDTVTINIESAETSYAGHHSSIGFFVADVNGNPIGGQIILADAHSNTFNVGDDVSAIINKADYPDGVTFGFFTVPDGVDHNGAYFKDGAAVTFKNVNGKWTAFIGNDEVKGAGEPAYFSDPRLNSDGTAHVYDNDHEGNYNWEDLRFPYSDADYGDLNLKIDVDGAGKSDDAPIGGAVTGQMAFDIGADVDGHKFEIEGPSTLQANGVDVEAADPIVSGPYITIEGRELVNGQPTGDLVYKLVFNTTSGKYVYSQYKALDHNDPNGDTLPVTFEVKLIDGDGDTATADIKINVKDSAPEAVDDVDSVTEDSGLVATGNVVTGYDEASGDSNSTDGNADKLGADGFRSIVWANADNMVVQGLYGTLTVKADGSYSYELDNTKAVVNDLNDGDLLKETFTYTVEDGDGDKSTADLVIDIHGKTDADPVPEAVGMHIMHVVGGTWDGDFVPDNIGKDGNVPGEDVSTLHTYDYSSHGMSSYSINNTTVKGHVVSSQGGDTIKLSGDATIEGSIYAHSGDDTIELTNGNTSGQVLGLIDGGEGDDIIIGGIYEDRMSGGTGDDTLTGGDAADVFVFKADSVGGNDTITDFDASEGDVIDLSALLSGFTVGNNNAATAIALKDYLSLSEESGDTVLTIDHDGVGGSDVTTTIRLDNVNLLNGGSSDDAIKTLLDDQNLIVE
ncbi:DUF5801 repeats-in-toxin domain-containing protein [Kiloniella majae]|uniref:DUF5801 repeats-in-toxin domain-containing protein n=1 Tax=Kiloniella majae TaxID=1938558 RepID=UPI000A27972F|nr:DUF5801 repeats-in-toxin domain-containing protein [Kiloniella majae]